MMTGATTMARTGFRRREKASPEEQQRLHQAEAERAAEALGNPKDKGRPNAWNRSMTALEEHIQTAASFHFLKE